MVDKINPETRINCLDVRKIPDQCLAAEIDNINVILMI